MKERTFLLPLAVLASAIGVPAQASVPLTPSTNLDLSKLPTAPTIAPADKLMSYQSSSGDIFEFVLKPNAQGVMMAFHTSHSSHASHASHSSHRSHYSGQ